MAATLRHAQRSFEFDAPDSHYELIHDKQIGTVVVWEAQAGGCWHKIQPSDAPEEIRAFLQGLSGREDTYFSVNEFLGWRLTRLLKSLRACYVDVDLGRPATRDDLDAALDALFERRMPAPSLAVFSGRGLHLYWVMRHTPAKALPVWQAVEVALIDALRGLGADPSAKDCTRVLRIAGTVNSKCGEEVRGLVLDGQPWTLHQLADEVLGHRPPRPEPRERQVRSIAAAHASRGIHPKATAHRRWHLVLADLHRIGQHHGRIPEGHRDTFLFLSSVALSWFAAPETIRDEVHDIASLYCPDLGPADVEKACAASIRRAIAAAGGEQRFWHDQPVDPRYRFRRRTLWERMEPLAEPIASKLRAIVRDDVAEERGRQARTQYWAARWADHYTGKGYRASHAEKVAQARLLRAQGHSYRAIAAELGVSPETARLWCAGGVK